MAYLDDNGLLYLWNKIKMLLANKVDKISGKQLSTNDYTTVEKNKLSGISDNATRVIVEQDLVNQSSNPLAGKVVQEMLGNVTNGIQQLADYKVDKESGKGLSTNDYTAAEKIKLAGLNNFVHPTTDGNKHVPATGTTNNEKALIAGSTAGAFSWKTLTKSMVGLGSVDNTSDMNKPVSTVMQSALNGKLSYYSKPINLEVMDTGITLSTIGTPHDEDMLVIHGTCYDLAFNVDGSYKTRYYANGPMSDWKKSNVFSDTLKSKLDGISAGANNYVHLTTSGNKHIPSGGTSGQFLKWSADGTAVWASDNNTTYGKATSTTDGLMAKEDKSKLDGIATGATKVIVEQELINESTNPLAGKVVQSMIKNVMDGVTVLGNQLDGKVEKVSGKGLSTNDYTTTEKNKLAAFGFANTYALKADIVGMYKYKGSVADASKLPTTGQTTGDVYNIVTPSIYGAAGANVAWDGSKWDSLGEIFTITSMTNAQIDTICA